MLCYEALAAWCLLKYQFLCAKNRDEKEGKKYRNEINYKKINLAIFRSDFSWTAAVGTFTARQTC